LSSSLIYAGSRGGENGNSSGASTMGVRWSTSVKW
jgi:hypothetical protein